MRRLIKSALEYFFDNYLMRHAGVFAVVANATPEGVVSSVMWRMTAEYHVLCPNAAEQKTIKTYEPILSGVKHRTWAAYQENLDCRSNAEVCSGHGVACSAAPAPWTSDWS